MNQLANPDALIAALTQLPMWGAILFGVCIVCAMIFGKRVPSKRMIQQFKEMR